MQRRGRVFPACAVFGALVWAAAAAAPAYGARITAMTVSPDGKTFAVGYEKGGLALYDFATRKLLRDFKGHTKDVRGLAFSPDGRTLATGNNDAAARLWNVSTCKLVRELRDGDDATAAPYALAFTPDGRTLLNGNRNSKFVVRDAAAGKSLRAVGTGSMENMAVSPDGKLVAFADNDVKIFDVATGLVVQRIYEHGRFLAFSRDGKQLLGGTFDTALNVAAVSPD